VANQGVGQFIDLGCGMPTAPNTDESARAIIPDAGVACVDNDTVVLNRLRERLAKGRAGVTVVDGDVREVAAILDAIHLAAAMSLRTSLSAFVTYDKRLAAAAQEVGLPVLSPV